MGILYQTGGAFRGLVSESNRKKRREKIKAKAKTCSMPVKRYLLKEGLGMLY